MRFIIPSKDCHCIYGSIHIDGKTKYISRGTIIFYGGKTFLISRSLPDYNLGCDLVVDCKPMGYMCNYYDVHSVTIDNVKYKYDKVSTS